MKDEVESEEEVIRHMFSFNYKNIDPVNSRSKVVCGLKI